MFVSHLMMELKAKYDIALPVLDEFKNKKFFLSYIQVYVTGRETR